MLDNETKEDHINDTVQTKLFLSTMIELSNLCRREKRTLYSSEVHSEFTKLGLSTKVRAGASAGKPMSATALNGRVKKSLAAIQDLALSAGNSKESVDAQFARLTNPKTGIMKVKETLDIGEHQPMALFKDLNALLEV